MTLAEKFTSTDICVICDYPIAPCVHKGDMSTCSGYYHTELPSASVRDGHRAVPK